MNGHPRWPAALGAHGASARLENQATAAGVPLSAWPQLSLSTPPPRAPRHPRFGFSRTRQGALHAWVFLASTSRLDFWVPKLEGNAARDVHLLRRLRWSVMTMWERQLRDMTRLEYRIRRFLDAKR